MIRIETIENLSELAQYASAWDDLSLKSRQQLPMLSHAWVHSYLVNPLEDMHSWVCLLAFDKDELVGVLPVTVPGTDMTAPSRPSLRTPYRRWVDVLCAPGREDEITPLLINALFVRFPGGFRYRLDHIVESSPLCSVWPESLSNIHPVRECDGSGAHIPTTGSFDDHWKSMSGSTRTLLGRRRRQLEKLGNLEIRVIPASESSPEHLDTFMKIEAANWKGRVGAAFLRDERRIAFYHELTRRLAEKGWLEWQFMYLDGRPIAAEFGILFGRKYICFRMGYDEEYKKYSPGRVLTHTIIQRMFEDENIDEFDTLTYLPWWDAWRVKKRTYFNISLYPSRLMPLCLGYLPAVTRQRLRSVPGLMTAYRRVKGVVHKTYGH